MSEHEALPALDELVAIRLLATAGRTLMFPHDQIREVAYLDSGEPRRRLYHERALELLDGAGAAPAELVRHALAADLADRALGLSIAAGDNALRLCAARDAIVHYERARALSPNTPNAHVFLQLGRAYELATEFPLARRAYEELLGAAQAASDGRVECAALNRLPTRPRWSRSRSGTRDGAAGSVHARDAQQFGRENGLLVAIRGGGHNGPGLGSCDDGLVIDLSLMRACP